MRFDVLSIFPQVFEPVLSQSITGRARAAALIDWRITDIRGYSTDKHAKVDDRPFGGGPGMVMLCQPVWDAAQDVEATDDRPATRVFMTPEGTPLTPGVLASLARKPRLVILCGRYEGVDERVIERLDPLRLSIGDFVVSGGELPAMLLIDAVTRLIPGVLGHEDSAAQDSFSMPYEAPAATARENERTISTPATLLDCPHYTRPRDWMGMRVPEVLLSGDHERITRWRQEQRVRRTQRFRPDLLR